MNPPFQPAAARLNELLVGSGLEPLEPSTAADKFAAYCALLMHWNARMNLTSIRDQEGILVRHFVESIAAARALPSNIATLLDFGSGAGFPGIPIALCRPEIAITLAESQGKKSAFLQEAVRSLGLSAKVHPGRAQKLSAQFDCVILRAVDRMEQAIKDASRLVQSGGWLALMTIEVGSDFLRSVAGKQFSWMTPYHLPGSEQRVLLLGQLNT